MKANPGGQLPPSEVLGRDALISQLWDALETRSILMTAERRIGKTSIIRKMRDEGPADWVPIFQDLEKVHTAHEFANLVCEQVYEHLSKREKVMNATRRFWATVAGTEIGGVIKLPEGSEKHWKSFLTHTIEDLVAQQAPKRVVFLWDEMPYMIDSIRRNQGEETAMEVLDVLRSLRQTYPGFRMVLTGSIGLHHVLTHLKNADYKNQPVNDMEPIEVGPLAPEDAHDLASLLIQGEGLRTSDPARSARVMADAVDRVPYYIHSLVNCLRRSGRGAEPDQIHAALNEQLVNAVDPWQLAHYRQRIPQYYPGDDAAVTTVLDHLATSPEPATINELLNAVKSQFDFDRNRLVDLLKLLRRDHYVAQSVDGRYQFLFPLIRRWWVVDRGL